MAIPLPNLSLLLSIFLLHLTLVSSHFRRFSPTDNYLLDCGSSATVVDPDGRSFLGDLSEHGSSFLASSSRSISLKDESSSPGSSPIYHTARVFTRPSMYKFRIADKGTHLVRLHFHGFDSSDLKFSPSDAQFHVLVDEFLVLNNFTGGFVGNGPNSSKSPMIKDYMLWVDSEELVISFVPTGRWKFAFVNAIEVLSAPKDLIADTAKLLDEGHVVTIDGLGKQALETVFRVTVGGPKVTPFNDSLWRTWVPDDEFLKLGDGSNTVYHSGPIRYQEGGASREVCPDNVYKTARVVRGKNGSVSEHNITWAFSVPDGYRYLIRTHFADIASIAGGLLYFNVYVNGHLVYEDLDLSYITNQVLASPFYADFVVNVDSPGILTVSVGPSNHSFGYGADAILNGVEVMKMNNSMGSLDGDLSAKSVMKSCSRASGGVSVLLIAAVCILLAASVVLHRRMTGANDTIGWSQLPVDINEVHFKRGSQK